MSNNDHKFYCGIEIEGLSNNRDYYAIEQLFKDNGLALNGFSADPGQKHFCLDTDGSINIYGRHHKGGYSDFEFKTPPFPVKFSRFPIPNGIMKGINLFKSFANPVINHSCGLHVHLSGIGMSIASGKERMLNTLQKTFRKYHVHAPRRDYCLEDGRYAPVRHCGKWHYEFRIFNGTINERALQTAVFNCLNATRKVKNEMRKEREAKNIQESFEKPLTISENVVS